MGAAIYIGRVGGLAVALGVGTAIATGYGVASADDTTSGPPSADTSTPGGSTETKTTTTTTDTQTSTEPSKDNQDNKDNGAQESDTKTEPAKGEVSAQTNTGTSGTKVTEPTEPAQPAKPKDTPKPKAAGNKKAALKIKEAPQGDEAPSTAASTRTVQSVADPTVANPAADPIAVFSDARTLASTSPTLMSPMMAAQITNFAVPQPKALTVAPNPVTAVANVVASVVNWVLNPLAGNSPTTPAQPPLIWGLLAFARREFDNLVTGLNGNSTESVPLAMTTFAAAALSANPPFLPFPSAQVSPSTQFVSWVTGNYNYAPYNDDTLQANTLTRYSIYGTDVGTMWDNGIPDDPKTSDINEHQVLIAVGDTFGGPNSADWRPNTILRSSDTDLSNGIDIPDGQWYTGNWFGGAPLGPDGHPTRARQVIYPDGLPAGITLIPTAGISVPTPGTEFGVTQYMSFMSVTQWGAPGQWTTNYSALAYSTDNGENWKVAPQTARYNQSYSGNKNFQQSAMVRPGDGYVYVYGTPNGRQGSAYVSRVAEKDILDLSKYEYYNAGSKGGWFGIGATKAGWYKGDPAKATPVFGQDKGACGVANPGNQVSEMSIQYNQQLKKYVVLYGDQFNNIVMRTSDTPQGKWSSAKVLMSQQSGGIYAPMMHPWSPSTQGTGTDLYWNLSLWSDYNVMLMKTDLTKV